MSNWSSWIERQKEKIAEGKEKTVMDKTRKAKRRLAKLEKQKPGAVRAITEGIMFKRKTRDVMRDEYNRRKYKRQKKERDRR